MHKLIILGVLAIACIAGAQPDGAPTTADRSRRAAALDRSLQARLVGRWTNPTDHVVIDIASVDLATGRLSGRESAPGSASDELHDLVGWVNDAPARDSFDHVVPVSFATALHEYGTLPTWAGFLRGDELVTLHYLVWPNRSYPWDHVTAGQETWTKLPVPGEWRAWSHDRKHAYMQALVLADERTMFAAYDAKRFATMTCKTCHGSGVADGRFKMPNPALPQLDGTRAGFQQMVNEQPAAIEFMRKIVYRTADLLGEPGFSMKTGTGFGCFACHVAKR